MKLFRQPRFEGTVQRIHTEGGSHVEPPFDDRWSNDDKLRWKAASVTADTGVPISVVYRDGYYGFRIGRSAIGGHDYRSAWDFLTGVSLGAQEAMAR